LLAVSQLWTIRSKAGRSASEKRGNHVSPDHAPARRRGPLLILAGEVRFADRRPDALRRRQRLAFGMQRFAERGSAPRASHERAAGRKIARMQGFAAGHARDALETAQDLVNQAD
jgi:hypothetical protein